jgi:hypothetical protein
MALRYIILPPVEKGLAPIVALSWPARDVAAAGKIAHTRLSKNMTGRV